MKQLHVGQISAQTQNRVSFLKAYDQWKTIAWNANNYDQGASKTWLKLSRNSFGDSCRQVLALVINIIELYRFRHGMNEWCFPTHQCLVGHIEYECHSTASLCARNKCTAGLYRTWKHMTWHNISDLNIMWMQAWMENHLVLLAW